MQNIPNELKTAIKNNQLIIFAGAGISTGLNLPNWKELVINLIDSLGDPKLKPFSDLIGTDTLSVLEVLNYLEKKHKRHIILYLDQIFGQNSYSELRIHTKLLNVSNKIITTNYDIGFEQAWLNEYLKPANVVRRDSIFKLVKLINSDSFIFKIHGTIEDPDTCVLFESQYENLYHSNSPFLLELKFLFLKNTILFVGFSMADPYVKEILTTITDLYQEYNVQHFILTVKDLDSILPGNVHQIQLENYDELPTYLNSLVTLKPTKTNLPPRPYTRFFGRKEAVKAVIQLLNEPVSLITVQGNSGVGKSALVFEVAYTCLQQHLDGYGGYVPTFEYIIWLSAQEVNQNLNVILDTIGRVYNSEKITKIPAEDLQIKEHAVNRFLQNHKSLIIIDNFESVTDPSIIEWAKRVPERSKLLITTTENPFNGFAFYDLAGLPREDALEFMHYELSASSEGLHVLESPGFQDIIVELCQNIRILQLAAGQIRQRNFNFNNLPNNINIQMYFHTLAWDHIDSDARSLLSYFIAFDGISSVRQTTLSRISELNDERFLKASSQLTSSALLTYTESDDRYTMPQSSRIFIKDRIGAHMFTKLKFIWSHYYINYITLNILRQQPDEEYWNALVSDRMIILKEDWNAIIVVIEWLREIDSEEADTLFLNFVLMLVHYMDSRFYNQERLSYVQRAVECCQRLGKKYEEALLRIDALGWTYSEESNFNKAMGEISIGLKIAELLPEGINLTALGKAWQARILAEQGNANDALVLVQSGLTNQLKPWIAYRVNMGMGDIYIYMNEIDKALNCYQTAKVEFNKYGGEGNNYQINPRIGLAYIKMFQIENNEDYLDKAEIIFESVFEGDLAIGNLYGEYGLALISYYRGNQSEALSKIEFITMQLRSKSSSNVLLKLINEFRKGV